MILHMISDYKSAYLNNGQCLASFFSFFYLMHPRPQKRPPTLEAHINELPRRDSRAHSRRDLE